MVNCEMYFFVLLSQCRYDVLKDYCLLRKTSKSGDGPCMEWSDVVGEVSVMNIVMNRDVRATT